jgi:hypothetical protein
MEEVPMLVDLRHLLEEFRKVAMGPLWGGPGGRQLAAFPPANTSSPAQKPKIDGSDIFRSITAGNQLPFQCLLPGILLNPLQDTALLSNEGGPGRMGSRQPIFKSIICPPSVSFVHRLVLLHE